MIILLHVDLRLSVFSCMIHVTSVDRSYFDAFVASTMFINRVSSTPDKEWNYTHINVLAFSQITSFLIYSVGLKSVETALSCHSSK